MKYKISTAKIKIDITRRASFIVILFSLFLSSHLSAKEITDDSFMGTWCGNWDGIYELCITIDDLDSGATAQYKWLEQPHGKFKKKKKDVERVNRNTLKIGNIWLILDQEDHNKASALGVFTNQSRNAELTKQTPASR